MAQRQVNGTGPSRARPDTGPLHHRGREPDSRLPFSSGPERAAGASVATAPPPFPRARPRPCAIAPQSDPLPPAEPRCHPTAQPSDSTSQRILNPPDRPRLPVLRPAARRTQPAPRRRGPQRPTPSDPDRRRCAALSAALHSATIATARAATTVAVPTSSNSTRPGPRRPNHRPRRRSGRAPEEALAVAVRGEPANRDLRSGCGGRPSPRRRQTATEAPATPDAPRPRPRHALSHGTPPRRPRPPLRRRDRAPRWPSSGWARPSLADRDQRPRAARPAPRARGTRRPATRRHKIGTGPPRAAPRARPRGHPATTSLLATGRRTPQSPRVVGARNRGRRTARRGWPAGARASPRCPARAAARLGPVPGGQATATDAVARSLAALARLPLAAGPRRSAGSVRRGAPTCRTRREGRDRVRGRPRPNRHRARLHRPARRSPSGGRHRLDPRALRPPRRRDTVAAPLRQPVLVLSTSPGLVLPKRLRARPRPSTGPPNDEDRCLTAQTPIRCGVVDHTEQAPVTRPPLRPRGTEIAAGRGGTRRSPRRTGRFT